MHSDMGYRVRAVEVHEETAGLSVLITPMSTLVPTTA